MTRWRWRANASPSATSWRVALGANAPWWGDEWWADIRHRAGQGTGPGQTPVGPGAAGRGAPPAGAHHVGGRAGRRGRGQGHRARGGRDAGCERGKPCGQPGRNDRSGARRRRAQCGGGKRHRLCALARRRPGAGAAGRHSPGDAGRAPEPDRIAAVEARRDPGAIARQQRHQRPPARPARCDHAVLWAGELSAAYVAGDGPRTSTSMCCTWPGSPATSIEPADLAQLSAAAGARYGFLAPYLAAAGQGSDRAAPAEEQ